MSDELRESRSFYGKKTWYMSKVSSKRKTTHLSLWCNTSHLSLWCKLPLWKESLFASNNKFAFICSTIGAVNPHWNGGCHYIPTMPIRLKSSKMEMDYIFPIRPLEQKNDYRSSRKMWKWRSPKRRACSSKHYIS